jgi:ubiquinone/menaquinone biosynthesis C-methylase UbiE
MARDPLEPVRAYYEARGISELHRLDNPFEGVIEREIHRRVFEASIPTGARVLDLGGGPGHWTVWLARRGNRVVLADISPAMLDIARREITGAGVTGVDDIVELDARDLRGIGDGEFDVVLALGPFYHLVDARDREQAAQEARRVLRPGGLLLATVMTRYAWLLDVVFEAGSRRLPEVAAALAEGAYRNSEPGRFTEAYLHRPEEVVPFFEGMGFKTTSLIASQSILQLVQEQVAGLEVSDPKAHAALLDIAYQACRDPSIAGLSGHLLYEGIAG